MAARESVEAIILKHCPEFETSWALPYVVGLVVRGRVSEHAIGEALGEYAYQRRRAAKGLRKRIDDQAAYLAEILKKQ